MWEPSTGRLIRTLQGHTAEVLAVSYSQNGALLASAGFDRTIRLWNSRSGALVRTLNGHTGTVTSIAFGPEANTIASGSEDGSIRIWSTQDGALLLTLMAFDDDEWIAYNPQGNYSGSARAGKCIAWSIGATVYDFDQFFEKFYTPDLLLRVFQGKFMASAEPPDNSRKNM